jgi:hypothetical protein
MRRKILTPARKAILAKKAASVETRTIGNQVVSDTASFMRIVKSSRPPSEGVKVYAGEDYDYIPFAQFLLGQIVYHKEDKDAIRMQVKGAYLANNDIMYGVKPQGRKTLWIASSDLTKDATYATTNTSATSDGVFYRD